MEGVSRKIARTKFARPVNITRRAARAEDRIRLYFQPCQHVRLKFTFAVVKAINREVIYFARREATCGEVRHFAFFCRNKSQQRHRVTIAREQKKAEFVACLAVKHLKINGNGIRARRDAQPAVVFKFGNHVGSSCRLVGSETRISAAITVETATSEVWREVATVGQRGGQIEILTIGRQVARRVAADRLDAADGIDLKKIRCVTGNGRGCEKAVLITSIAARDGGLGRVRDVERNRIVRQIR